MNARKTPWRIGCLVGVAIAVAAGQSGLAQSSRHVLMEGTGEHGWSVRRPSPINGEAEGRVLALNDVSERVESMANIRDFERFSGQEVTTTLRNKYEKVGDLMTNTTTFIRSDRRDEAFRANRRGLVVAVEESGFKPGTFSSFYRRDQFTGVRSSGASGILLYKFTVYAPEGYDPNGSAQQPQQRERVAVLPDGSRFVKDRTGGTWTEYDAGGRKKWTFREVRNDGVRVYLRDDGRKITLGLPLAGGKVQWQNDGQRAREWEAVSWADR